MATTVAIKLVNSPFQMCCGERGSTSSSKQLTLTRNRLVAPFLAQSGRNGMIADDFVSVLL